MRLSEIFQHFPYQWPVSLRLHSPGSVAEILFDQTFLALRRTGQHGSQFARRGEFRVRNAGDKAVGIYFKLERSWRGATPALFIPAEKQQLEFITPGSDGVELLESVSDRIDQIVTGRATRIGYVLTQPLAVRLRFRFGDLGQVRVNAWRRLGDMLAKKLLSDEEPTRSGRRIVRFCSQGQEEALPKQAGAF